MAGALGLPAGAALENVPSFGHFDDGAASDMNTVLWAPTIGYFLDQMLRPLVSSATADRALAHFAASVRGRRSLRLPPRRAISPTACCRCWRGRSRRATPSRAVSPVASTACARSGTATPGGSHSSGGSDRPDADLIDLLRRTPRSVSFRFRQAMGSAFTQKHRRLRPSGHVPGPDRRRAAGTGRRQRATRTGRRHRQSQPPGRTREAGGVGRAFPRPSRCSPNYIDAVRSETTRLGVLVRLLADPAAADSLLEALLRQAAMLELAIGATRLVVTQEIATGALSDRPPIEAVFDREVIGIDAAGVDDDAVSVLGKVSGPIDVAKLNLPPVSGQLSLADFLATRRDAELLRRPETQRFAQFRAALQRLARIPSAELARLTADTLDCASHRLDAWITSLATRRLAAVRKDGTGCHIGAFGYVEKLAPRAAPSSQGYLQGPSIAHATTAAVLRSAHLAGHADDEGVLALDLSSNASGAGSGAHRRRAAGSAHRRPARLPLRAGSARPAHDPRPVHPAVAPGGAAGGCCRRARRRHAGRDHRGGADVVDGILLLQRWKAGRDALYDSLPIAVPAADRTDIDLELARIDDALDAVSDLLVAESVHQAVLGNSARSAAALDALDRQTIIPDIAFARTPRSGSGASHRLLVLFPATAPADGWAALVDAARRRAARRCVGRGAARPAVALPVRRRGARRRRERRCSSSRRTCPNSGSQRWPRRAPASPPAPAARPNWRSAWRCSSACPSTRPERGAPRAARRPAGGSSPTTLGFASCWSWARRSWTWPRRASRRRPLPVARQRTGGRRDRPRRVAARADAAVSTLRTAVERAGGRRRCRRRCRDRTVVATGISGPPQRGAVGGVGGCRRARRSRGDGAGDGPGPPEPARHRRGRVQPRRGRPGGAGGARPDPAAAACSARASRSSRSSRRPSALISTRRPADAALLGRPAGPGDVADATRARPHRRGPPRRRAHGQRGAGRRRRSGGTHACAQLPYAAGDRWLGSRHDPGRGRRPAATGVGRGPRRRWHRLHRAAGWAGARPVVRRRPQRPRDDGRVVPLRRAGREGTADPAGRRPW